MRNTLRGGRLARNGERASGGRVLAGLLLSVAAVLFLRLPAGAEEPKWDPAAEIRRLAPDVPRLDSFAGASGLVWLRDLEYRLGADGALRRTQRWLVLVGERLDPAWRTWRFPDPETLRIEEATLRDARTGERVADLRILSSDAGGVRTLEATLPEGAAGRLIALSVTRTVPRRTNVDDLVFLALDLPLWEQRILVRVPAGSPLFWADAGGVLDPSRRTEGGEDRYEWIHRNQRPWRAPGLLKENRPALAFSMREGLSSALRPLADLEARYVAAPLPSGLLPRGGSPERTGLRFLRNLDAPERRLSGLPWDFVRDPADLPPEGPWSPWETVLLAERGLTDQGFRCQVFWLPALIPGQGEKTPATERLFLTPVLKGVAPGGSVSYFLPGQAAFWGGIPPSLAGETLLRAGEGDATVRETVPVGDVGENKLVVRWDLNLAEDGTAAGSLDLTVRGAWAGALSGGVPPEGDLARWALERFGFVATALKLSGGRVEPLKSGYRVLFGVSCIPGIAQGAGLFLRLPGSVPLRLEELASVQPPARLRFPFLLEQQFLIRTPEGYRAVSLPTFAKGREDALLDQSLVHWPRKGVLEGRCRLFLKSDRIDSSNAATISQGIAQYMQYGANAVGLKK